MDHVRECGVDVPYICEVLASKEELLLVVFFQSDLFEVVKVLEMFRTSSQLTV